MIEPKFKIGQKVKFSEDHDRSTGSVLSVSFHSENASENETGWVYKISSKFYDPEQNDMIEGVKICKEEELVDMADFNGDTTPEVPTHTVALEENTNR